MNWNENLTNLNYLFAGLYPLVQNTYRIIDEAGIPRTHIAFQPKAIDNWYEILLEAAKRNKIGNLVEVAYKDYPEDPYLMAAVKGNLNLARGPLIGRDIAWKAATASNSLEKLMGTQSTLLPIHFLEVGLLRAKAVARVRAGDGSLGTGFLIKNNLFLTNNHVIESESIAQNSVAQFGYEQTADGVCLSSVDFLFDPDSGFLTSSENDWTCVRLRGDVNHDWGEIHVAKVNVQETQRVNIIQHPGGEFKQIAIYRNVVTYFDDERIQYLTDTLPGSSGAPVFDSQWRLVGIHHSGGHIREPATQNLVFRNEGININCVIPELEEFGLI